ncbi:MAG: hypothetical protein ACKVX7_03845 [Planctomycetota bacterium]
MEISRDEVLIDRVVDGDATAADWAELELLAERDPGTWQRLGLAIRSEAELRLALESELACADRVELPIPSSAARAIASGPFALRPKAGWVAAALVLATWGATTVLAPRSPSASLPTPAQIAETESSGEALSANAALRRYVELGRREGRVLAELPNLVMEKRALPDQQAMEVLYLRRTLERATVDQFFDLGRDEFGQPASIPVSYSQVNGGGSL